MAFLRGRDALRQPDSSEFGPFPTPPSRTVQATFAAHGSPEMRLHRSWACAASTAPVGVCPPSPALLPPVLGITPGLRVLRVLCDPAALAVSVIPSFPSSPGLSVGAPWVVAPLLAGVSRKDVEHPLTS